MNAVADRLGAGSSLDCGQAVGQNGVEDVDHLPIAVVDNGKLAPYTFHRGRQHPVLEGRAVAQGAGFAGEHWHVMPGIVDRLATAERARMLGDNPTVLADHDAGGIGVTLDRTVCPARHTDRAFAVPPRGPFAFRCVDATAAVPNGWLFPLEPDFDGTRYHPGVA